MTPVSLQAAAQAATAECLAEADRHVTGAMAETAKAWTDACYRVATWDARTALSLGGLVIRETRQHATSAGVLGVEHSIRELKAIAPEAAQDARNARPPSVDVSRLTTTVMGLLDRLSPGEHPAAALQAEQHQIGRIVETECFREYNRGRSAVASHLASRGDGETYRVPSTVRLSGVPAIVMRWDATLDRRSCPTCKSLAGRLRPLGAYFEGHSDPPVHPRCRCVVGYWPVWIPT
jgi:hypothetical protein